MNRAIFFTISFLGTCVSFAQDIPFMDGTLSSERKADRYFEERHYAAALEQYQRALKGSPDDDAVKLKIARCYTGMNDRKSALQYYDGSINSGVATDSDVLDYAEALHSAGDYDNARKWYDKYTANHAGDERVAKKLDGLKNPEVFYLDSVAYDVKLASFNSSMSDFSPVYWKDKTLFVSNRERKGFFRFTDAKSGASFLDIYAYENGYTTKTEAVSKRLHEGPLAFFDSGNKAVVTVNHKESQRSYGGTAVSRLKLAIYDCSGDKWKYESDFPYNSEAYSVCHPSFDEKTQTLYFASDMPEGKGGTDLYRCDYREGKWSAPENLQSVNTSSNEAFPFKSSNGDLYFASDGLAGLGGLDIYKAIISGTTVEVYNLGYPVNTSEDDFGLALDSTERHGYISSNRRPGVGGDDVYELSIFKVNVETTLKDKDTGLAITGAIEIVDMVTGRKLPFTSSEGKIVFEAIKGRPYKILAKRDGYDDVEMDFRTDTNENYATLDVLVVPVRAGTGSEQEAKDAAPVDIVRIVNLTGARLYWIMQGGTLSEGGGITVTPGAVTLEIQDVFFRFDDTGLLSGSQEIQTLSDLLRKYNTIELEIIAYCDGFGSREYNDELARKRAEMVIERMTQMGVKRDRLQYVVVGSRKLFGECEYPNACTVEQNRKNRRIEFKLMQADRTPSEGK